MSRSTGDSGVVTFKDIDRVHGRPEETARRNFNKNRKHFIEGEDFFTVKPADIQMSEFRTSEINNRSITLLAESILLSERTFSS